MRRCTLSALRFPARLSFSFSSVLRYRFESQHLLHALGEGGVKKWLALSEGQGGTIGLLTTHGRKEQYCLLVREALRMGAIALNSNFFSCTLGARDAKARLADELANFSIVTEPPKNNVWSNTQNVYGENRRKARRRCAGATNGHLWRKSILDKP